MHLPEPKNIAYKTLISDIEKGLIKIPQFQRDFVWTVDKSAALIDSILKGYPIGTFITWKTKERLRVVKNLGNVDLPDVPEGDFAEYVLDGQQRMTSLYCALKGVEVDRGGRTDDFSNIYVDLAAGEQEQIVTSDPLDYLASDSCIKLTELVNPTPEVFTRFQTYFQRVLEYGQILQGYNFSVIEVKEAPIDVATEIFTRINVGGKPLTLFEIMAAKTFDAERDFDLAQRFDALIERLTEVSYNTLSDATVLQTMALVLSKECKRQNILRLEKQSFIEVWPKVQDAIEAAADYFRGYYRVPVSNLLPYNSLFAPFAYFFYHHPDKPTGDKQRYLEDFFWRSSLSGRFLNEAASRRLFDLRKLIATCPSESPAPTLHR